MNYNIISTGSKGNAVVLNDFLMIDCGVSFASLKNVYKGLKIVLLTHIHSDHFNKSTIKSLAKNRPTLRFACCNWLLDDLLECGVEKTNIDILVCDIFHAYSAFTISPFQLDHNVPNCGYRVYYDDKKLFYATDTGSLDGITAKNYDLYMIESNHTQQELQERIKQKVELGEYAYELDVAKNHLSKEKADNFIYSNIGINGEYVYLHQHKERSTDE